MSTLREKKLWGEFEEVTNEDQLEDSSPIENLYPIIELGLQNIPEIPITEKTTPIELPQPNLITHTIQLHAYATQLENLLEQTGSTILEGPLNVPSIPPQPEKSLKMAHKTKPAIHFLNKEYCDFSLGNGPMVLPFTPESHKRALKQCAAISLAHIGVSTCTNTVIDALSDTLDMYMSNMCKLLRTVVDREASGINSGYPDAMSKVLADLNVGNLHDYYENNVVRYHATMLKKCENLKSQCETHTVKDAPQLKLEEVPELHFPAVLDGAFNPSLETGFQMLQNLEQEQLDGLEFIEIVGQDVKLEPMDLFVQQEQSLGTPSSPNSKKKRK